MKVGVLILCMFFVGNLCAQDTIVTPQSKSNPIILNQSASNATKPSGLSYENELSLGLKATTNGWGIFGDYTKDINLDKKRLLYFELAFVKSPKETKRVNEFTIGFTPPKPFVYGKQNSFLNVKAAIGEKRLLGQKAEKSGFQIAATYAGGFSAGLIKPYYLEVYNNDPENGDLTRPISYSSETSNLFLDATSIYGASGFGKGFNEISLAPGLFGKAGFNFDWATYDDFVKSLEAGVGCEVYLKDIPIMILENNKPYFLYLYLSLQFGKKW